MEQNPELGFAARQLSREALQQCGNLQLHVISASMVPLLIPGDSVLVQPVQIQELRPGQIVVYERGTDWITHRLIRQDEKKWTTKGDASLAPDAPVQPREVIGRVVVINRTMKNGEIKKIDLTGKRWLRLGRFVVFTGRMQAMLWNSNLRLRSKGTHPFVYLWLKIVSGLTRLLHRSYLWLEVVYVSRFSY